MLAELCRDPPWCYDQYLRVKGISGYDTVLTLLKDVCHKLDWNIIALAVSGSIIFPLVAGDGCIS